MALRLAVEITGDAGGLREGVQAAGRGLDDLAERGQRMARQLRQSLDQAGRRMRALGQRLSLALTAPIAGFGALSVKTASDMQELRNLIAVTFGDATEDVEAWATRTAEEVNRARLDLLKAAGDFAAFLKPLGVAPDQIVPMSTALAELTTDIASFRNLADESVVQKFFSGLAGEPESVRRLGVDIGEAALQSELLAMGIEGGIREATQAQKVMARYNLIMAQTTDAQGDAARTAGSFENQLKGFGAAMTDLRVAVGTALLPVATELVSTLAEWARWLSELNPEILEWGLIIGGALAVLGPLAAALGFVVTGIGLLVGALATISAPVAAAAAGIAAFAALIYTQWDNIIADIERLKAAWSAFADFVSQPLSDIVAQSRDFLVDQLGGVWETVKSGLRAVRSVFVAIFGEELVSAFEAFHVRLFEVAVELMTGLKDTIVGGFEWIRDRVKGAWESVVGIFEWGQDVIVGNSIVPDMVEAVLDWFARMGEGMAGTTRGATDDVARQFTGLGGRVDGALGDLDARATRPFRSIADAITGPFQDALTKGQFSFRNFGQSLIQSADQMADRLVNNAFRRINDALVNLLSSGLQSFLGGGGGGSGTGFGVPARNPTGLNGFALTGFSRGAAFEPVGRVTPFASGTVVDRPTLFPMRGGHGLMAEEGPEAIMPLVRLPSGRLGVERAPAPAAEGGRARRERASGDVNVTVNLGAETGDDVRRSAGRLARETGRAVRRAQRFG